ncbi:MAG: hypothetical protein ACXW11_10875 [Methylotenera sp.]
MEIKFAKAGWSNNSISVLSMMGRDSASVRNHQCAVLFVDADFSERFGNTIDEMGAMIRNCSIHIPLYLVFEGDYDPSFVSWLEYTKRLFKSTTHHRNLRKAIHEIIRLETVS